MARWKAAIEKAKEKGKDAKAQEEAVRGELKDGRTKIRSLMLKMLGQKAKARKAVSLEVKAKYQKTNIICDRCSKGLRPT